MLGIDTDNDSAFLNDTLFNYCKDEGITLTRSRAYHKNDQAWVEQKNGSVVRKLVGYGRLEGLSATAALRRLYESSRLYTNYFQPSFKLTGKTRCGARVHKIYDDPLTPFTRLRTRPDPFANVWPMLLGWLEEQPDMEAKTMLKRLQASGHGHFPDGQLRTLQPRVRVWRMQIVRHFVYDAEDMTVPTATTLS